MSNTLEYAQVLQQELDRQIVQQATSGWMENNAGQVRYSGGSEVKIPVCQMTGLGGYDREAGKYPQGAVTLAYETRKLTQDRAAQFYFDRNDVDETNYLTEAAAIMAQFQREHVIPEVDAYRYSVIAQSAAAGMTEVYKPTKKEVLSKILSTLRRLQDKTGIDKKEFIITVPFSVFELLEQSDEITRVMQVREFDAGDVQTEVNAINGVPVIAVPGDRMFTHYNFFDGSGEMFGFASTGKAVPINYIIAPRFAPLAVSKTDNLKIFAPDENQDGDGWKTQYRKYHDIWLKESVLKAVFVSLEKEIPAGEVSNG